MKKLVLAVLCTVLSAGLYAQPQATFQYRGQGCGWFQGQDLVVSHPPRIGQYVEFRTHIPPYGTDFIALGSFDPQFPIGNGCKVRAFAFPGPTVIRIPFWFTHRMAIPNDPALAGFSIYAQQLNYVWSGPTWETSRGVKLTLGY